MDALLQEIGKEYDVYEHMMTIAAMQKQWASEERWQKIKERSA